MVAVNLNDEVAKGRTIGPFSTPPFQKSRLSVLFPKSILTNYERYFIYPTLRLGPLASIILLKRTVSPSNTLRLCLAPVRLSPRPSRSIDFGDVSQTNGPEWTRQKQSTHAFGSADVLAKLQGLYPWSFVNFYVQ